MLKIFNRREFIKKTTLMTAGMACGSATLPFAGSGKEVIASEHGITATIPLPVQIVIDDVGWWSGKDGHEQQEPYRTGIDRNHAPADYEAIVQLGRALHIRPQAAMILCEWDKENILKQLPTSTWMGPNWNNSKWIGPWLEEAADIIRSNKEYFEFTIHGIGHEYWEGETFTRAEWADGNGTMRPRDQVEAHLDFFELLMNQHNLGSFPTSFVPTAFLHGFGVTKGHAISMAEILSKRGIKYINTPFEDMYNAQAITHDFLGFDTDVMTVDRGRDLLSWKSIGAIPRGEINGPTCGLHWPNLLHPDTKRNLEIVDGWVRFLRPYDDRLDRMLAPDSEFFHHQLAHNCCTKLSLKNTKVELDFSEVDKLPNRIGENNLIIKLQSAFDLNFIPEKVTIASNVSVQQKGFKIYKIELQRIPEIKKGALKYIRKI